MISTRTLSNSNRQTVEHYCSVQYKKENTKGVLYHTKLTLDSNFKSELGFKANARIRFINRGSVSRIELETSNRIQFQGAALSLIAFTVVLFLIHGSIYVLIPSFMAGLLIYFVLQSSFQKSLDKNLNRLIKIALASANNKHIKAKDSAIN